MTVEEGTKLVEGQGYKNVQYIGEENGILGFRCKSDKGFDISVFVYDDGYILIPPTD